MDPAAWLTLLVERAPMLRAAGIVSVQLSGDSCSVALAASKDEPEPELQAAAQPPRAVDPPSLLDPLDDPATFGGSLPGYDMSALLRERAAERDEP